MDGLQFAISAPNSNEGGILLLVALVFYFFPTLVGRKHHNVTAIFVLILFLGWTLIGWVVALIWAVSKATPEED